MLSTRMAAKKAKTAKKPVTSHAATLRDDPDDARRLVLADELQQRGDPLGEFIVVQCELARLPIAASRRRIELQLRVDDLVARYHRRWLEGLPLTDKEKPACTFHRGFPLGVTLAVERFLRDGNALFEQSSFSELAFTALAGIQRVKPDSLARIKRLQFQPTPGMARTGPRYVDRAHLKLLRQESLREHLRSLVMWGCAVADAANDLTRAPGVGGLEVLDLSNAYINDDHVSQLCTSGAMPRLQSLALGGNRLSERAADAIASCGWPLTALTFAFPVETHDSYWTAGQMQSAGLAKLAASKLAPKLRTLVFENQQMDDAGPEALASTQFESLEVLSLAGNRVGVPGLRALGTSKALSNVTSLDLSLNPVGEGIDALVTASMPKLASLHLAATEITDAHLDRLLRAPWIANLVELDLSDNAITDESAAMFASASLQNLASLHLRNTKLSAKGLKKVADATNLLVLES
jgi:uncharacterized protein (TIGR02996 family)